jgi:hypothetical protein
MFISEESPRMGGGHYTCSKCGRTVYGSVLCHCEPTHNFLITNLEENKLMDDSILVYIKGENINNHSNENTFTIDVKTTPELIQEPLITHEEKCEAIAQRVKEELYKFLIKNK